MEIRSCSEYDLLVLRTAWPFIDDVHGAHFAEQHHGGATYLVAWISDEPLGSELVQWRGPVATNARLAFPQTVEVTHLDVRRARRGGQGVGTSLLLAAERLAAERGCTRIAVSVAATNTAAARLYQRLGFRPTGVVDVREYEWTDDEGRLHHEIETTELVVKGL